MSTRNKRARSINCEQALNISTTNAALQTDLDSLTCSNSLRFLAACGKIHKFLRRLVVRFSTSCGFLRLDFQLLAFQKFLRVNRKNTSFLLLAADCAFLRRKNFLRHFLRALFLGCTVSQFPLFRNNHFTSCAAQSHFD